MAELNCRPVKHERKSFLERAHKRNGFSEAYDALEVDYQVADQLIKASARAGLARDAVGCRLEVRLVPEK